MRAAAQIEATSGTITAYIEEMTGELATLAERIGQRDLAAALRLIAIQAARTVPVSEDLN